MTGSDQKQLSNLFETTFRTCRSRARQHAKDDLHYAAVGQSNGQWIIFRSFQHRVISLDPIF